MRTTSFKLVLVTAALATAGCSNREMSDLSTDAAETEELIAAVQSQPEIASGQLREGPDTHLLPPPTGPAPGAHAGHGHDQHHQHR